MLRLKSVVTLTVCFIVIGLKLDQVLSKPLDELSDSDNVFDPETFDEDAQAPPNKEERTYGKYLPPVVEETEMGKKETELDVKGKVSESNDTTVTESDNAHGHRKETKYQKSTGDESNGVIKENLTDGEDSSKNSQLTMNTNLKTDVNGTATRQELHDGAISTRRISGHRTYTEDTSGHHQIKRSFGKLMKNVIGDISDFESYFISQIDERVDRTLNLKGSTAQISQQNSILSRADYNTNTETVNLKKVNPDENVNVDGVENVKVYDAKEVTKKKAVTDIAYENGQSRLQMRDLNVEDKSKKHYTAEKTINELQLNKDGSTVGTQVAVKQNVDDILSGREGNFQLKKESKLNKGGDRPFEVIFNTRGIQGDDFIAKEDINKVTKTTTPEMTTTDDLTRTTETKYGFNTLCKTNFADPSCKDKQMPPVPQQTHSEFLLRTKVQNPAKENSESSSETESTQEDTHTSESTDTESVLGSTTSQDTSNEDEPKTENTEQDEPISTPKSSPDDIQQKAEDSLPDVGGVQQRDDQVPVSTTTESTQQSALSQAPAAQVSVPQTEDTEQQASTTVSLGVESPPRSADETPKPSPSDEFHNVLLL